MTFGSLFAGIGGFDLGLERAEMRCVWQVEKDEFCRRVLAKHWPNVRRHDDVKTFPPTDATEWRCDLIAGGFPCQDLSVAGKRAGLSGERSGLFWHVVRLASELRPRWLLLENVPGLLSSNDGRDMGIVVGALQDCGYSVAWRVLDARYFGLAQRRKRVWIVCHSDAERAAAVLFEPEGGAWDSASREEAGPEVAYCLGASPRGTGDGHGQAWNTTYIPMPVIAHTLRAEYDASEDGTGRGTPIVPDTENQLLRQQQPDDRGEHVGDVANTLTARDHKGPDRSLGTCVVDAGPSLDADGMLSSSRISRRLDGPRYRSLGNAAPVPVVTWIGRRILEAET